MLDRLKNFDVERLDLDELVELSAIARSLAFEYQTSQLDVPQWLTDTSETLRLEIKGRNRDRIQKSLREAKARLESLKTPDEKKADLLAAIDKLQAQLQSA